MAKEKFCISDCPFLTPQEEELNHDPIKGVHDSHYCTRFKIPVFHGPYHQRIMRVGSCDVETEVAFTTRS